MKKIEEDFEPIFENEEEMDAFFARCAEKRSSIRDDEDFVPVIDSSMAFAEEMDSHTCYDETGFRFCSDCGAIIPGSCADYRFHGYDPPGTE